MIKAKNSIYVVATVLAFFAISACSNGQPDRKDTVNRASRLIDSGRDDEAIELLESSLGCDPNNTRVKVVLASAYAHKAGFRVQSLLPAMGAARQLAKRLKFETVSGDSIKRLSEQGQNLATLMRYLSGAVDIFSDIPGISPEKRDYLDHAIYILEDLGDKPRQGDVLYRAVLEVVRLKSDLSNDYTGDVDGDAISDKCQLDLKNINQFAATFGKQLIDIFSDIGYAIPKEAAPMKDMIGAMKTATSNLTIPGTSLMVLDDATKGFLRQTAIQANFSKILSCTKQ